mgnify:CR=1 FL=1
MAAPTWALAIVATGDWTFTGPTRVSGGELYVQNDIAGGLIREIQVILDQERLRSYGLTVADVLATRAAANRTSRHGKAQR